jgi:hypothetical protein
VPYAGGQGLVAVEEMDLGSTEWSAIHVSASHLRIIAAGGFALLPAGGQRLRSGGSLAPCSPPPTGLWKQPRCIRGYHCSIPADRAYSKLTQITPNF